MTHIYINLNRTCVKISNDMSHFGLPSLLDMNYWSNPLEESTELMVGFSRPAVHIILQYTEEKLQQNNYACLRRSMDEVRTE